MNDVELQYSQPANQPTELCFAVAVAISRPRNSSSPTTSTGAESLPEKRESKGTFVGVHPSVGVPNLETKLMYIENSTINDRVKKKAQPIYFIENNIPK